jgi:hypothetical protein
MHPLGTAQDIRQPCSRLVLVKVKCRVCIEKEKSRSILSTQARFHFHHRDSSGLAHVFRPFGARKPML